MKHRNRKTYTKVGMTAFFLKGSMRYFVYGILGSFAVSLLEMLMPQVTRFAVDSVIGSEPVDFPGPVTDAIEGMGGVSFFRDRLWVLAIVIAIMAAVAALCRFCANYYNAKGAEGLLKKMRDELFGHIQRLPFSWHMKNQTGDIIQRCTSDVETVRNLIAEQLTSIIRIVRLS